MPKCVNDGLLNLAGIPASTKRKMKTVLIYVFMFSLCGYWLQAQEATAIGGCSSVTVTQIPDDYPVVYTSFSNKPCKVPDEPCCIVAWTGIKQLLPQLELQKLDESGEWQRVAGPINDRLSFDELDPVEDHGTYRVRVTTPYYKENGCNIDGMPDRTRIEIYDLEGKFIGYQGTYDNFPYDGVEVYFTNEVIVGPVQESDIGYFFVDVPEMVDNQAYDFGEDVIVDFSETKNYNSWWLAVFESGPVFNRYWANNGGQWTNRNTEVLNLSDEADELLSFEAFHSYLIQFAASNTHCPNWQNVNKSVFICPAGSGCHLNIADQAIKLYPNPANQYIYFDQLPNASHNYLIWNSTGQLVQGGILQNNQIDIQALANGFYSLSLRQEGTTVFTTKLLINH